MRKIVLFAALAAMLAGPVAAAGPNDPKPTKEQKEAERIAKDREQCLRLIERGIARIPPQCVVYQFGY